MAAETTGVDWGSSGWEELVGRPVRPPRTAEGELADLYAGPGGAPDPGPTAPADPEPAPAPASASTSASASASASGTSDSTEGVEDTGNDGEAELGIVDRSTPATGGNSGGFTVATVAVAEDATTGQLDDLFDGDTGAGTTDGQLDNLFDTGAGAGATAGQLDALFDTPTADASLNDLFAPTAASPAAPPAAAAPGPAVAVVPPVVFGEAAAQAPAGGRSGGGGKGKNRRLDRMRAAIEEAAMVDDGAVSLQMNELAARLVRMQEERERLWPYINRFLGVISAEPSITQVVGTWKLTRNAETYNANRAELEELFRTHAVGHDVSVPNPRDVPAVFDAVLDEILGIGPLGMVWRDDTITEILVDAWDRVTIEREGRLELTPLRFRDPEHASKLARDLASSVSDRALNISNPLVTAELDRARVNFAYGPIVKSGLSISLRKFRPLLSMAKLLEIGAVDAAMVEFLTDCVAARATLLVSGGTGTGKTTMLNALSEYIPDGERVVTIEDSFELTLSNMHVVSLQTKERASSDDTVRITLEHLLVNSLRMRPDRIVVGEIREPHGARAMLQAATTGHDGTMTTIHANTPQMALSDRLSDLQREATGAPDEVCKRSVASAIDLVVQVVRKQGRRYISEISVVDRTMVIDGAIVPEPVFVGDLDADGTVKFTRTGGVRSDTELAQKLRDYGIRPDKWEAR